MVMGQIDHYSDVNFIAGLGLSMADAMIIFQIEK